MLKRYSNLLGIGGCLVAFAIIVLVSQRAPTTLGYQVLMHNKVLEVIGSTGAQNKDYANILQAKDSLELSAYTLQLTHHSGPAIGTCEMPAALGIRIIGGIILQPPVVVGPMQGMQQTCAIINPKAQYFSLPPMSIKENDSLTVAMVIVHPAGREPVLTPTVTGMPRANLVFTDAPTKASHFGLHSPISYVLRVLAFVLIIGAIYMPYVRMVLQYFRQRTITRRKKRLVAEFIAATQYKDPFFQRTIYDIFLAKHGYAFLNRELNILINPSAFVTSPGHREDTPYEEEPLVLHEEEKSAQHYQHMLVDIWPIPKGRSKPNHTAGDNHQQQEFQDHFITWMQQRNIITGDKSGWSANQSFTEVLYQFIVFLEERKFRG